MPAQWEQVMNHPRYEICTEFPHQIRKKSTERIISEHETTGGYISVWMDGKHHMKHVIIAKQWVNNPKPEDYNIVDHINNVRCDNHISNLRWCNNRQNTNKRLDQKFVETLSDEAIVVQEYNEWKFTDLYFYENKFYVYNGINYVIKPDILHKSGQYSIRIRDNDGELRTIYYSKFKRSLGII